MLRTMTWVFALTLAGAQPHGRKLVDRIVAIVNEEIITLSELDTAAKPFLNDGDREEKVAATRREVLDQLISDKLIGQQITEAKISVGDEEIDRAVKDILRQNNIT